MRRLPTKLRLFSKVVKQKRSKIKINSIDLIFFRFRALFFNVLIISAKNFERERCIYLLTAVINEMKRDEFVIFFVLLGLLRKVVRSRKLYGPGINK